MCTQTHCINIIAHAHTLACMHTHVHIHVHTHTHTHTHTHAAQLESTSVRVYWNAAETDEAAKLVGKILVDTKV